MFYEHFLHDVSDVSPESAAHSPVTRFFLNSFNPVVNCSKRSERDKDLYTLVLNLFDKILNHLLKFLIIH